MTDKNSLEDLRSKIIESMVQKEANRTVLSSAPSAVRAAPLASIENDYKRKKVHTLPNGPRGDGSSARGGHNPNYDSRRGNYPTQPSRYQSQGNGNQWVQSNQRFQGNQRSQRPYASNQGSRYGAQNRYDNDRRNQGNAGSTFQHEELTNVTPVDKRERMQPSKWDITPTGFEKVPAEKAKLAGLFPQPGQPQIIDHNKLAKVVAHGGSKSRRTRNLFEDPTDSNIKFSKTNTRIVIDELVTEDNFQLEGVLADLKKKLASFLTSSEDEYELRSFKVSSGEDNPYLVLELDSMEAVTVVLACREFFNGQVHLKEASWNRPGQFILQSNNANPLCDGAIVAITDLTATTENQILQELAVEKAEFVKPLFSKESGDGQAVFTGSALVKLAHASDNAALEGRRWFKPNASAKVQDSSAITYQTLSRLVTANKAAESRVVLLLNSVDPLDLKNSAFAAEIKQTLLAGLAEVDVVKMRNPAADYRLTFEHVGENIGHIYVKFRTTTAAAAAIRKLSGARFNDRAVLCAYYAEQDFDKLELL